MFYDPKLIQNASKHLNILYYPCVPKLLHIVIKSIGFQSIRKIADCL